MQHFSKTYDYVFTTGGIGPTHDDITSETIAKAFGVAWEMNEQAREILLAHYGEAELTEARLRMAMIPAGASLIPNPVSSAPGFKIENVHVMAGVPRIMQGMLDHILPTLAGGVAVQSVTVSIDIAESKLSDELGALQDAFPDLDIGSYPNFRNGKLGVSAVMRGRDESMLAAAKAQLIEVLGAYKVDFIDGDLEL